MHKIIMIAIFAIIGLLASCVKEAIFTEADGKYIFGFDDLEGIDLSGFEQRQKNGAPYFYTTQESELNGVMRTYIERRYRDDSYVKLTASFNIQSTSGRAKQLYDGIKNVPFLSEGEKLYLEKESYGIDEGVFYSIADIATIGILEGRLHYLVQIEGIEGLDESGFRRGLIARLTAIKSDFDID